MNGRPRRTPIPMVGASSLLTIFAVLCLTVFAALSLATASADARLSRKSAQAAADYYAADAQAEEILARLRSGELPEGVTVSGGVYAYAVPVSDTQELRVEAELAEGRWQVLRWQTVYTAPWEPETDLHVWDGGLPE